MKENGRVPAKYKSPAAVESMKSLRKPATRIPVLQSISSCKSTIYKEQPKKKPLRASEQINEINEK